MNLSDNGEMFHFMIDVFLFLRNRGTFQHGQALVEVVIVVGIVLIMISVLVSGTVVSLKSSNFSTQKSQSIKFAQEGIELARLERDKSWSSFYDKRSIVWCVDQSNVWSAGPGCTPNINGTFIRSIALEWNTSGQYMDVISTVAWRDGNDYRQSELKTNLTEWK
jgi:type II secretory pathway pseudopilin PulG